MANGLFPRIKNRRRTFAIISRPKAGALRHFGVLLPEGCVAHCSPSKGEHISTVSEFAAGNDVLIEKVVPVSEHNATLERIAASMHRGGAYDLLLNNCEIFANRITAQAAKSDQLRIAC